MVYGNGGTTAGGYASTQAYEASAKASVAPPRPSVITDQLMTQERRLEELHNLISELENRLHVALSPDAPAPDKPMPADQFVVPLGAALASLNDRVALACRRIQSITNRVEL